jgi:hypothetical protein
MPATTRQLEPPAKHVGLVSQLEIIETSPDLLRARSRNLYVMRWSGACSEKDLRTVFREMKELTRDHATVVVVSLLDSGATPPTAEGREIVAQQQAQLGDRLVLANLVDGQGFWASIVLNALLGIQVVKSKRSDRERVFRDRQEACVWLKQFVAGEPPAHEVDRVIQRCREVAARSVVANAS